MRILIGSLLLVVLTATLGLGWTLDRFYDRFASGKVSDEVQIYKELGAQIAAILDVSVAPDKSLIEDVGTQFLDMHIQASKDFPLPASMQKEFEVGKALVLESDDGVTLHYYLPSHGDVLTIIPTHYNANSLSSIRLVFTLVFYIGVLALLLLWLYPLIRRLMKLRAAAKDFGSGQLDHRINTQGVSYIADIEVEFNRMAERIQTLVSDNKLLSSAVSHDLRTPLARLRFGIDTLEDTRDPAARKKYTQRLSADISEMEKLVSSLLDFARLDHVLSGKKPEVLAIEDLVATSIELHEQENISITLNTQSDLLVPGDEKFFAMLLRNLLQNALRFASQSVHVELRRRNAHVSLSVSDDGPGIPMSEHRSVLMPFTRGDATEEKKGHGLGLAIVNRIAQWHGGSVNIDKCPDLHGARITVLFPVDEFPADAFPVDANG